MATKIIKAWIDGAIQEIEVEDIVSPEQPLSVEDRLIELEDKPIITDGNILVGNGTDEMEEMTPEEVLSHINGASVTTMTTAEYEELEESNSINANTLYMLSDAKELWDIEVAISEDGLPSLVDATPMQVIDAIDGGADIRLYVTVSTDEIRYYHINGRGTNSFGDYINFTHSNPIEVDMITISRNERNGTVGRLISPLVDNLLFDQSTGMLYMMGNGRIISNGVRIAEGEGNNAVLTLENTTGWSNKIAPNDSNCTISFNWSSIEGEVSTGSGTVIVKVGGELQYNANIRQGECTLNILNYLNLGQNIVHVTVIDAYGNSQTLPFGVTMYDPNALISTKLVERTLTGDYTNDRVTKVGSHAFEGLTLGRLSLPNVTAVEENGLGATATEIELESLPELYYRAFMGGKIDVVKVPSVVKLTHNQALFTDKNINRMIFNCVNLETSGNPLASSLNKVVTFDFHRLTSLPVIPGGSTRTVIIRTPEVCALQTAPGTTAVNVYVPASLVDSYKLETNWSEMADKIFAIEDYPDICEVSDNA